MVHQCNTKQTRDKVWGGVLLGCFTYTIDNDCHTIAIQSHRTDITLQPTFNAAAITTKAASMCLCVFGMTIHHYPLLHKLWSMVAILQKALQIANSNILLQNNTNTNILTYFYKNNNWL